jgi:hypothetical protein
VCQRSTLDCESFESALKSVAKIYRTTASDILTFLSSLNLAHYPELQPIFESRFGPAQPLDSVCWFHLTSVPPGTKFSEGILPLDRALDRIWTALTSILDVEKKLRLEQLRKEGVPNEMYAMKTEGRDHFGPHAMLVREIAFHADRIGNHDYLELPEIVEHICYGYERLFGDNIREEVAKGLQKCIVKVELPADSPDDSIEEALLYCWCKVQNQELSLASNACFDGKGAPIAPDAIRKVEFIE